MNANAHIKSAHGYSPLLILVGLVLAACVGAQPAFRPAATIVLAPNVPGAVSSEHLDVARRIVQERLNAVFAASSRVTVVGPNLKVELSSAENAMLAGKLAKDTGIIEFWDSPTPVEPGAAAPSGLMLVMNGLDIARAQTEKGKVSNDWQVILQFTPSGTEKLAQYTASNLGRYLLISSDRQIVSAPRIQGAITGGQAVIAGAFTELDARSLTAVINSGALPVPLKIVSLN